jgi:hypothetical protein
MSSCEEQTCCWFCWEVLEQEEIAPSLGCSCKGALSTAHRSCMKEWLIKHPESCPNCRVPYDQKVVSKMVSPRSSAKNKSAGKCSNPSPSSKTSSTFYFSVKHVTSITSSRMLSTAALQSFLSMRVTANCAALCRTHHLLHSMKPHSITVTQARQRDLQEGTVLFYAPFATHLLQDRC